MKTTSIIRFAALSVVLLASVKVSCQQPSKSQLQEVSAKLGPDVTNKIILCLMNLVMSQDITVKSVLKCVASSGVRPIPYGAGNFANFIVKNGKSIKEDGVIQNAALSWGKWQQDGQDVTTVNNIEFNNVQEANFRASGRDNSPSGAEGQFEIHVGGKNVAVVEFDIPFWGENHFKIRHVDDQFLCNQSGFTSDGSPTINIKCHKLASRLKL
ncbi:unnamed protein product, partial [Iphiclides podalirius]